MTGTGRFARSHPRPRHQVGKRTIKALSPVVRYSPGRDAYVLRGVGHYVGPVLVQRRFVRRDTAETH